MIAKGDLNMRLITRSDFDGLACGALLKEAGIIDSWKFAHPKDLQDGLVEVTENDCLANVPYVEGCGLWFDHHSSEHERNELAGKYKGESRITPSCARIIYDYYGGKERFSHFDDMMENGREVTLVFKVFDNGSGLDFEQEYDDYELNEIIDNWLSDNCVNHRFNKSDATESMILYEQVRIPLYRNNGSAMDTYSFARDIARYFKKEPYNIPVKAVNKGLGKCELIFGEK